MAYIIMMWACIVVLFMPMAVHLQMNAAQRSGRSVPTFVVVSPKRAKYDTLTRFSISASNVMSRISVSLLLRAGYSSEVSLNETVLHFDHDGVQTWGVIISSSQMSDLQQNSVQLRAQYGVVLRSLDVLMNQRSGHILVQTDKVMYTPRQKVMYRVVALDNDQRFAQWPITVDVKNPHLIIVERRHLSAADAFTGHNLTLPKDAAQGVWFIQAYFQHGQVRTSHEVKFEVKEYVLPTYKVEVYSTDKVIAVSSNWIQVNTKAMYSYGEPVRGSADLRLGFTEDDKIFFFNKSYSGQLDEDGEWVLHVPMADLRSHPAWFPNHSLLYLEVNVTEQATGEVSTGIAMDTFFANPFYRILFDESKRFFKPGFPYRFVCDVKAANGDPASDIMVYVIVEMKSADGAYLSEGFSIMYQLDHNGRTIQSISNPFTAASLRVQVFTLDPRVSEYSDAILNVAKYHSPSNYFLFLNETNGGFQVAYTPSPHTLLTTDNLITVLVVSKGRLVHSMSVPQHRSGNTLFFLPQDVQRRASPRARMVAYFYVEGVNSEMVSDSLMVDFSRTCLQEVSLSHSEISPDGGENVRLLPKAQMVISINGGSQMRVGLLAVDKSVFFISDGHSLTRDKVFSILEEADEGSGVGDGGNAEKMFEFAGLRYMILSVSILSPQPSIIPRHDVLFMKSAFRPLARFIPSKEGVQAVDYGDSIPLERVRKYFPESWLFKEITLPQSGRHLETIVLPDTITTWSFTALGVGSNGGVCMSRPMEITAFKPFFVNVLLPYKVFRLEEVPIHIGIYNYNDFDMEVDVIVTGDIGACFFDGFGSSHHVEYVAMLVAGRTNSQTIRVIPLVTGPLAITVDVMTTNGLERDAVQRTLHVAAEGRRIQRSITFPLDPSGHHSTHHQPDGDHSQIMSSATLHNFISVNQQRQTTTINLFMPEEIIHGSESCHISACGDLMGDIISTAILDGDNLFESKVVDAEEAIGNLAPPVYALLYLNQSSSMNKDVLRKGETFVLLGVNRLLTYRNPRGSYSLTTSPTSQPATWLTALVLKTLCHIERITFVDHGQLIVSGFAWLLDQVMRNGTMSELDRRVAQHSFQHDLLLSSETLIAIQECSLSRPMSFSDLQDDDLLLLARQVLLISENLHSIYRPLVMAKAAYALTLYDPTDDNTLACVHSLMEMRRMTRDGFVYWSVMSEYEPPEKPFWYHRGSRASSIEATAYALLVFVRQTEARAMHVWAESDSVSGWDVNLDSIAGWLIQRRNINGAFIGAMDTAVATQALSAYSLHKQGVREVNLHCSISSSTSVPYSRSFEFNEQNALIPKALSDVPVGIELHVETEGTGLGQMSIQVEYNVPVEANENCRYNVTISVRPVSVNVHTSSRHHMCRYCSLDCDKDHMPSSTTELLIQSNDNRYGIDTLGRPMERQNVRARHSSSRRDMTNSLRTICIEVCIRPSVSDADQTILAIEMLSGYEPYVDDLQRLLERQELSLSGLIWIPEKSVVKIKFARVSHGTDHCVSFRARERYEVSRRKPASVTIRFHDDQDVTCIHQYMPVASDVVLPVYCNDISSSSQGQCRCFSGLCGRCRSSTHMSINKVHSLKCRSPSVLKVNVTSFVRSEEWVTLHASVLQAIKYDSTSASVQLITPTSCPCSNLDTFSSPIYFFGSHVDMVVDRNNRHRHVFLLDDSTTIITDADRETEDGANDRIASFLAIGGSC